MPKGTERQIQFKQTEGEKGTERAKEGKEKARGHRET